jgi:hypothetical protein
MLTVHARPAVVAGNARASRASARVVAGAATARVAPAKSPALSFRTASLGSAGAVRAAPRPARVRRAVAATASAGNAVTFSAADLGEAPKSGASFVWKGAKLSAAALSVGVGLAVQFLIPCPAAVAPQAWTLLAIFLSTITGLVLTPLPVGAWAFLGLSTTVVTKTLTFQQAFSAMTNDVIWLIVLAFFFAKGFVQTGLGDRVATFFVKNDGQVHAWFVVRPFDLRGVARACDAFHDSKSGWGVPPDHQEPGEKRRIRTRTRRRTNSARFSFRRNCSPRGTPPRCA